MNNTDAVSRGLAQSAAGETVDLGDFTQYLIPDAAVEAATTAVRRERAFAAAAAYGAGAVPQCAEMIAYAALTAALPFLGAAPSATRDEVAGALEREFGCFLAHNPQAPARFWGGAADVLLARFTITPRTDG